MAPPTPYITGPSQVCGASASASVSVTGSATAAAGKSPGGRCGRASSTTASVAANTTAEPSRLRWYVRPRANDGTGYLCRPNRTPIGSAKPSPKQIAAATRNTSSDCPYPASHQADRLIAA